MPSKLNELDLRCLQMAAEGVPVDRIAEKLDITPAQVREHFAVICTHFKARNIALAITRAIRVGLIG